MHPSYPKSKLLLVGGTASAESPLHAQEMAVVGKPRGLGVSLNTSNFIFFNEPINRSTSKSINQSINQ